MNSQAMLAPFADEELHTFTGQGGREFTYIEDETVMDRLDLGYGPGGWSVQVEAVPYVEGCVKVILSIKDGDVWTRYEDFGYPNNAGGGQALKEAVSDGIRRCGRYVGIARDLYRKTDNTMAHGAARAPQRPPAVRPAPARPHVVSDDLMEPDDDELEELHGTVADDTCPIHNVKWGGTPGDLFHKDPDGRWCRHPNNVRKAAGQRR